MAAAKATIQDRTTTASREAGAKTWNASHATSATTVEAPSGTSDRNTRRRCLYSDLPLPVLGPACKDLIVDAFKVGHGTYVRPVGLFEVRVDSLSLREEQRECLSLKA